jgi:hypothetical protein
LFFHEPLPGVLRGIGASDQWQSSVAIVMRKIAIHIQARRKRNGASRSSLNRNQTTIFHWWPAQERHRTHSSPAPRASGRKRIGKHREHLKIPAQSPRPSLNHGISLLRSNRSIRSGQNDLLGPVVLVLKIPGPCCSQASF